MTDNKTFQCPACGGRLVWAPDVQKLRCPYCGSEYDITQFEDAGSVTGETAAQSESGVREEIHREATDDTGINPEDLRVYRCSVCGAEIVTDRTTVATFCAFCGSPVVLAKELDAEFRPTRIIPFKITLQNMKQSYRAYLKSRPFAPREFQDRGQIDKIRGVYVPFWLYNMKVYGSLRGRGERISTYSDADFIYTRHRVYDVQREGTTDLRDVPVDASSRTPNDVMDSIEPFNFEEMVPFRMAYMPGYLAERYDEDDRKCEERAVLRARSTMDHILRSDIPYTSFQILNEDITPVDGTVRAEYVLLPVYLVFTKYRDQSYLYAVNGQTGRAVGDTPVDRKKAAAYFLRWFALFFAIFALVLYLI